MTAHARRGKRDRFTPRMNRFTGYNQCPEIASSDLPITEEAKDQAKDYYRRKQAEKVKRWKQDLGIEE